MKIAEKCFRRINMLTWKWIARYRRQSLFAFKAQRNPLGLIFRPAWWRCFVDEFLARCSKLDNPVSRLRNTRIDTASKASSIRSTASSTAIIECNVVFQSAFLAVKTHAALSPRCCTIRNGMWIPTWWFCSCDQAYRHKGQRQKIRPLSFPHSLSW